MADRRALAVACGTALLAGACGGQPVGESPGAPAELPAATVELGTGTRFSVELADEPAERAHGLAGRAQLPPGTGMLFTYPAAEVRAYWMRGMLLPIDIAWIAHGKIRQVQTLHPCPAAAVCARYPSPGPVDTVLEVPAGALTGTPAGTSVEISGLS